MSFEEYARKPVTLIKESLAQVFFSEIGNIFLENHPMAIRRP